MGIPLSPRRRFPFSDDERRSTLTAPLSRPAIPSPLGPHQSATPRDPQNDQREALPYRRMTTQRLLGLSKKFIYSLYYLLILTAAIQYPPSSGPFDQILIPGLGLVISYRY